MNKPKLWFTLTTTFSALICLGLIIGTFAALQFSQGLPDAKGIREIELKIPLRVYSSDGLLISEFGNERRIPIDYDATPKTLINAILASEDDNFFNHLGIDILGLVRATLANLSSGRSGQGASTITMQVARNFYLSPEKTYTRKIKEILLAIRLEQVLEKQEILSLYLNKIFLGHRAYGFGAAAEVYYGKSLNELNLAQIAMLAGLPKAPSSYNPIRNPERATIRRNYVLKRMSALNWITPKAFELAKHQAVTAKRHDRETELDAPHIAEMVRAQLIDQHGEGVYWQGLNVYTTIVSDKQDAATTALRAGLQAYDRRHGYRGPVATIDLSKVNEAADSRTKSYQEILREFPSSYEQTPALVTHIETNEKLANESATLWTSESGFISLAFEQIKWAKKHLDANRIGSRPKNIAEVLSIGDIVYVKPLVTAADANNKETSPAQLWSLSQIPDVSGSIISLDPRTGAIISLVGGYDFFLNKYNRATQSVRQPGSNIKPFIYSASLEKGFTPSSLISGAPIVLTDPAHGTRWRPQNYSGKFFGPTRMRVALSKSLNLVSIRLLRAIGTPFAREYAERFGIDMNRFSNSLTMALGAGGVKPIEMISAYSVLANGGYRIKPYFIERITNRSGELIFQAAQPKFCDECIAEYLPIELATKDNQEANPAPSSDEIDAPDHSKIATSDNDAENIQTDDDIRTYTAPRVMTHANNHLMVNMLKDVIQRGTARRALALNRNDLAGKTGTTNDYIDAWFTGFNSQVATTVWVGFDQPSTMGRGESGSLAALPIWVEYMKTGLAGLKQDRSTPPHYIESGFVNRYSGRRVSEGEPGSTPELFVIDELTPEYALQQQSNLNPGNQLGLNNDGMPEESLPDSTKETESYYIDPRSENPKHQEEPKQRIIETDEDTNGLF